jgi:hypothetical protein
LTRILFTTEVDEDGEKKRKPMKRVRVFVLPFDNVKLVKERKRLADLNGVWKKGAKGSLAERSQYSAVLYS